MCCEISFCDDFFDVCKIRRVLEKKNTNLKFESGSYQLSNVNIQ